MAALNLKEDQTSGQLILESSLWTRLVSAIGNLGWVSVFAIFYLVPSIVNGRFNPESLIVFLIILLFSIVPAARGLFASSIKIDRSSRFLTRTLQLLFIPVRSTSQPFNDLVNIEVQSYRASNRRVSREAYRVNAIDRAGNRVPLNWDGGRDEIFDQAQKIAAMTGAPLLDNTKSQNMADELIEKARRLGVPLPQELTQTLESSAENTAQEPAEQAPQMEPSFSEPEPNASSLPAGSDLRSLGMSELELRVAKDPTNSDARYALASKFHARGQLDRAIELYQATLQTDTSNAEAQNDLGVALHQRGKRAEAEAAYRRAIALDPFSFRAHLNLALLLRTMNRATEASQEFFQSRQNARGNDETRLAEAASTGARVDPQLSNK